jgi:hypothetical protein
VPRSFGLEPAEYVRIQTDADGDFPFDVPQTHHRGELSLCETGNVFEVETRVIAGRLTVRGLLERA